MTLNDYTLGAFITSFLFPVLYLAYKYLKGRNVSCQSRCSETGGSCGSNVRTIQEDSQKDIRKESDDIEKQLDSLSSEAQHRVLTSIQRELQAVAKPAVAVADQKM